MGLTYQDLLNRIEAVLETKFSDKFNDLFAELKDLKQSNSDLIKINKALISQNKDLRSLSSTHSDSESDIDCDIVSDSDGASVISAPCH